MKHSHSRPSRSATVGDSSEGWYSDTVWEYYLRPDQLAQYDDDTLRYAERLLRIPAAARKRLKLVAIRCPVKGCLLATIYEFAKSPTAEELSHGVGGGVYYLYVGKTPGGTEVWDIINYACACDRVLYWRAGCRCGTATLDKGWMKDTIGLANRWHHALQTEEQAIAALPEHLRPFWGKRVFHPDPAAWRARTVRRRRVHSLPPTSERARAASR